jgi:hypothetical protein
VPRKPKPPPDDPEQSRRFIETARERETDESQEAFDRAFRKVTPQRRPPPKAPKRDSSE